MAPRFRRIPRTRFADSLLPTFLPAVHRRFRVSAATTVLHPQRAIRVAHKLVRDFLTNRSKRENQLQVRFKNCRAEAGDHCGNGHRGWIPRFTETRTVGPPSDLVRAASGPADARPTMRGTPGANDEAIANRRLSVEQSSSPCASSRKSANAAEKEKPRRGAPRRSPGRASGRAQQLEFVGEES